MTRIQVGSLTMETGLKSERIQIGEGTAVEFYLSFLFTRDDSFAVAGRHLLHFFTLKAEKIGSGFENEYCISKDNSNPLSFFPFQ